MSVAAYVIIRKMNLLISHINSEE